MASSPLGQRIDNGSSSQAIDNYEKPHVGSSYFDISRVHTTTCDVGGIYPLDCFKVLLGDRHKLSGVIMIDSSNPLVKPLMSRVRAYVHYYYCRSTDLWKGYQNFITTGRRSSANLTLPYVTLNQVYAYRNTDDASFSSEPADTVSAPVRNCDFTGPMCLPSYFQLPFFRYLSGLADDYTLDTARLWIAPYGNFPLSYKFTSFTPRYSVRLGFTVWDNLQVNGGTFDSDSASTIRVCALPFVMYQKIYRDFYLNKNLSQNNKNWFPDSEDDFILPYDVTQAWSVMNDSSFRSRYEVVPNNSSDSDYWDDTSLLALRYRQWRGDYFTESLPWQYRGDEPIAGAATLPLIFQQSGAVLNGSSDSSGTVTVTSTASQSSQALAARYAGFSANNIRELFTMSEFRERMAKTNGDYNELMQSQFGKNPHIHEHNPIYIGGFAVDLNASQVEATSSSENEPLGSTAGRLSALGKGDIADFVVPDNGYIMAVLSIVPDVVYANQSVPRWLNGATSMAEEYFPLFNNLAPQGITTSELWSGTSASFTKLFGWIDRYMDYKTRQNYVSGLLALPSSVDNFYSSRVWIRRFTSEPVLNNAFVTMAPPTIDRNIFSSPTDPAFVVQYASRVDAIRPMPFKAKPAGLNGYAM